jgi:glutamine synthetase
VGATGVQTEKLLTTYTALVDRFKSESDVLTGLLEHEGSGTEAHAAYMRDTVVPAMAALREAGDAIEVLTPDDLWPLPTYREMLFVK